MKLKRMMSLLMCFAMLASVVFNNPQALLTVQATETTSETEDQNQYETETKIQETEDVIESDIEVETYLEEELDEIQDEEDSSDTYIEEEKIQENNVTTEESSRGRSATGSVAINEANFPDSIFREYVKIHFDNNGDDELSESELGAITWIDVSYEGICDLEGIEYFAALEYLNCGGNNLTSLDVSNSLALKDLNCENNALTSLDVSNHPTLEYLSCYKNVLASLDVSNSLALKDLSCYSNALTNLDVSNHPALEVLNCSSNALTSLDVSNSLTLENLTCSNNALTSLDVSNSLTLENLYCSNNDLISLDVSNNPALRYLACYDNALTSLKVNNNPALEDLNCRNNTLTNLDVSNSPALKYLTCSNNALTSLKVNNNPALEDLNCHNNTLTSLDVSNNPVLKHLSCSNNALTNLDVSNSLALAYLDCYDNTLTSLTGIENLDKLYNLDASNNLLTKLPDMTKLMVMNTVFTNFQYNYLSESELRGKLPEQLLKETTWLQEQIDNQYKVPAKPTALALSISSASSMKIAWTKASGVSGYEVWYATSKTGTYQKAKTTTVASYTQTGLKAGTTYYYKIRSYKTVSGVKVYGAYTSVTSKKLTVPTPKNVKVTNSSATSLKISWSKVADTSGYEIYCATSKTGTYSKIKTITSGTTASYTNKSLKNNKTYYYKVRAYKTVNGVKKYSSYCSILSKKVVLAKTTLTAATKSKTSIKLSWTAVSGATKYEIYRATSKNGTYKKIKTVTTVSYTNTKLTSNKTYYYKVKAVQSSYKSTYSAVKSAKTSK